MQTSSVLPLLKLVDRRALSRALRSMIHGLALLAGMLSSGVVSMTLLGTSNEVELPAEVLAATEYAQTHEDVASRLRRPSSSRMMKRAVAPSALPTFAGRLSTSSAYATALSHLSLGLSIPIRC
jgi:hypothetical protein